MSENKTKRMDKRKIKRRDKLFKPYKPHMGLVAWNVKEYARRADIKLNELYQILKEVERIMAENESMDAKKRIKQLEAVKKCADELVLAMSNFFEFSFSSIALPKEQEAARLKLNACFKKYQKLTADM